MKYVCADCGHETNKMNGPCDKCKGFRIVLIEMAARIFGENWREDCFGEKKDDQQCQENSDG